MANDIHHVALERDSDLGEIADAVYADKEPRILERDGKPVAALVSVEDLNRLLLAGPSREAIEHALGAIGAWRDLDGNDDLAERVYRNRHASPPSPPVTL